MDWNEYRQKFEEEARRRGRSSSFIEECLRYAKPLAESGLPVIYNFSHLSSLLGFEEAELLDALIDPTNLYKSYAIPKMGVGYRLIDEPVDSLKSIQRWILDNILNAIPSHAAAMAFRHGRSIKQNAHHHLNRKMVLSLDVMDFFHQSRVNIFRGSFERLGTQTS